jgi:DNA-binding transcriptional regulator YiaG
MGDVDVLRLSELRYLVAMGEARPIRERARLSLPEVAAYCGVTYKTIRRWEAGERPPRGAGALRYASLLAALTKVESRREVAA